jgi:dipeptidyl aminopeptidase/acylaminoacyl peptidase
MIWRTATPPGSSGRHPIARLPRVPPTLIIHGDADKLVPVQQAEIFVAKAREVGATVRLVVKAGAAHGWPDLVKDLALLADWFDLHLRGVAGQ